MHYLKQEIEIIAFGPLYQSNVEHTHKEVR